ncbi:hypothetical protein LINPERPRIM_LOCUS3358 [Linum perenne]
MRHVVPTRLTLRRRGIEVDHVCGVCSNPGETMEHLLFSCVYAHDCWVVAGLQQWIHDLVMQGGSFTDVMFTTMQSGMTRRGQRWKSASDGTLRKLVTSNAMWMWPLSTQIEHQKERTFDN